MSLEKLQIELAIDPLGRDYASKTAAQVVDSLYTVDRVVADDTPKTFRDLLRAVGGTIAGTITTKLEAAGEADRGVKLAVEACGDYGSSGGLDFSHAYTIAALDALQTASVLTETETNYLKALGQKTVSRAEELGLSRVRIGTVMRAR